MCITGRYQVRSQPSALGDEVAFVVCLTRGLPVFMYVWHVRHSQPPSRTTMRWDGMFAVAMQAVGDGSNLKSGKVVSVKGDKAKAEAAALYKVGGT